MRTLIRSALAHMFVCALVLTASADFPVIFGSTSWDGIPLQDVLDAEYGAGVIDAATDYEGYLAGDADPPYWLDAGIDALIIRELAGYQDTNVFGWYAEDLAGAPILDGVDDGVIFTGPMSPGASAVVNFPGGVTQFGFYMNPNGPGDSGGNAPEPETFFTNRFYHDIGPNGGYLPHAPSDGDPQCLVYNLTDYYGGVPTYVLAWEDLDSGSVISDVFGNNFTDNDFQDLVVEIQAMSPVRTQESSWGQIKSLYSN